MTMSCKIFFSLSILLFCQISAAGQCVDLLSSQSLKIQRFNVFEDSSAKWAENTVARFILKNSSTDQAAEILSYFKANKNLVLLMSEGRVTGLLVVIDGYETSFNTYLEMFRDDMVMREIAEYLDDLKSRPPYLGSGNELNIVPASDSRRSSLDDYDRQREEGVQYRAYYGITPQDDE